LLTTEAGMGWAALVAECISMEVFTELPVQIIPSQCVCKCTMRLVVDFLWIQSVVQFPSLL